VLLTVLIAYSVVLVAIGWWVGRRVRQSEDFFVGRRSLGPLLIFATFLAPNIGAGSTVGAAGFAYEQGLAAWWWNASAGIGSFVLAFWVGPRIWREARRLNLLTLGDLLEHRYGRAVRGVAATAVWLGTPFVLCAQLNGAARVLEIAGGVPHWAGCLIATTIIAAYFASGGLPAAARVNGIQLIVKLAGFALAAPLALMAAGGWAGVAAGNADRLSWLRGSSPSVGWPWLFLLGPAFFLSPGLIQKAYGARSERTLTIGVAANAAALIVFALLPVTIGLSERALDPHLAHRDLALPAMLARLSLPVGGLALAAVFSAELSAADAVLFMLGTSGARDLYQAFVRPAADDRQLLRAARIAALAGGALGYLLTFVYDLVGDALTIFYSIMVVTLFAPTLGALVAPGSGRWAALTAMLIGLGTFFAVQVGTPAHGFGWASAPFLGIVTSSAVFLAASVLRPAR